MGTAVVQGEMMNLKRTFVVTSAIVSGVISSVVLSFALLLLASYSIGGEERVAELFQDGGGPGLTSIELIALTIGLGLGFWLGIAVWSIVTYKIGWLTLSEIESAIKPNNEKTN